jgi:hypothetical protein
MKDRLRTRTWYWTDLLVLASYIVLSLILCMPLPARLGSDVAGRYVDARVFQWNNWWVKRAILNRLDLDYTRHIYAPSGVSLASHNFNWISSALSVPLDMLVGPIASYNLLFTLTFWLSGFSTYLLVLHLTGRRDAAFVAGLVYAFTPYHLSGNWDGQMNLANVQWLPLFVLFLLRTVERKRIGDALLAGLFFALSSLDCWFFALFLCMWGLIWLAYSLIGQRERWNGRTVGLLALAAVTALVLMAPFLAPLVAEAAGGTVESALAYHADDKATDLLAYFVPSSDHPLLGEWVRPVYERFQHWRPASLGYAALALALCAVVLRPQRSLLWLISGLFFLTLALGTTLTVNGVPYPDVPTPYRLLTDLVPALKIVRQANRFNVMVGLSLAVLAGIGWAGIAEWMESRARSGDRTPRADNVPRDAVGPSDIAVRGRRRGLAVFVLAGVLILFEYLALPCPLQRGEVSPFYHALAQEGEAATGATPALLELPIDDFNSRYSLYPQTVHGLRLVNGYVARTPPGTLAYIRSQPLIKFAHLQMEIDPTLLDVERQIGLLAANEIDHVVIHKQALPPQPPVDEEVMAGWRATFGPEVHYEDDEIVVYRTRLAPGQGTRPILRLGEDLALTEVGAWRTWTVPAPAGEGEDWLTLDLTWTALADLQAGGGPDVACSLSLFDTEGMLVAEGKAELISPRYPTSRWPKGVIIADQYALPLDPELPAGAYRLDIAVRDLASGANIAREQVPVQVGEQAQPLVPALAEMQYAAGVTYGGEMRLLGYDRTYEDGRVDVALYWQALTAIQDQYKVFVHLLDEEGTIVAQHDGMPYNWAYPTSLWGRREVYIERISLDVLQAEEGAYRLAVGVYSVETGRLPAVDVDGQRVPGDQAVLEMGD